MDNKPPLILIVDDNPQNCQFLGNLLAENGYELGVARDGLKALEFVRNDVPDLILLDVMMPEMDGLTVLKALREIPEVKSVPVIFMTARSQPKEIEKLRKMDVVGIISKPFDPMTLAEKIKNIWDSFSER